MKTRCFRCRQNVGSEGLDFHERGMCRGSAYLLDERGIEDGPERDLCWAALMLVRRVDIQNRTALETTALRYAASHGWTPPWYAAPDHLSIVRECRSMPYVLNPIEDAIKKCGGWLTDFYPTPNLNAYRVDMRPYILKWRDRDIFASRDSSCL